VIYPRSPWPRVSDSEWDACVLCGGKKTEVEVQFNSGSVEPQEDEVLTGATSEDTGIVVSVTLESGTWAGEDAVGTLRLISCTGIDDDGLWAQAEENINGSVGGDNMLTLADDGFSKVYARLWPTDMLTERNGKLYCPEHYAYRFRMDDLDAVRLNLTDRGGKP
jgi:hypothetical protein